MLRFFKKRCFAALTSALMLFTGYFCVSAAAFTDSNDGTNYICAAEFNSTEYSVSSGLPSNCVNAIEQTDDGFIWFGTDCGLVKYNTKEFSSVFSNSLDGFENICITALAADLDGRLWVGTADNGLYYIDDDNAVCLDTKGFASQKINSVDISPDGNIIAATSGGIVIVEHENLEVYSVKAELTPADKNVVSVCASADGLLWCVTNNGVIYFIADDIKAYVDIDGDNGSGFISDSKPVCVYASTGGRVYIGTDSDDILYFTPCSDGSFDSGIVECQNAGSVTDFCEDRLGRIWFSSNSGIGLISGENAVLAQSRFSGRVNCTFSDREGNLWFGSSREGALKNSPKRFIDISLLAGISDKLSNAVAVYNNILYIGTDNGLVMYDSLIGGKIIENELTALLSNVKINSLLADKNGNLLIGTDEKYGLIKYNAGGNGAWSLYNAENGLVGESVLASLELENGSIAVATDSAICIFDRDGNLSSYDMPNGVNAICEGRNNTIYAASNDGVYVISNGLVTLLDEQLSNKKSFEICYCSADDSLLISCTKSLFLYSLDPEPKLTDISSVLPDGTSVYDIVYTDDSGLLLVTESNVYQTNCHDLSNLTECSTFSGFEKLNTSVTPYSDGCYVNDSLYICCIDGVFAVRESEMKNTVPQLYINAVYADGESIPLSEKIEIDSRTKIIEIDVSLLSYIGEGTLTYKLEGVDDSEVTVNSLDMIRYMNLDGGNYTFTVCGTALDGSKTNTITFEITKKNIWHESPLFWLALVVCVAIVSFLISAFYIVERVRKEEELQNRQSNISTQAIAAVAETIDAKTNASRGHSRRVAQYSCELARRLKCSDDFIENLYCAALLHDIGNIGISDEILKKPHKLTPEELYQVQRHTELGSDILRQHEALRDLSDAVRYHHERYDGMGYCKKLAGDAIPLASRIIFACESLDAMFTEKPYRPQLTRERAISEFRVGSGTQFDPEIAEAVIKMIESGYKPE